MTPEERAALMAAAAAPPPYTIPPVIIPLPSRLELDGEMIEDETDG